MKFGSVERAGPVLISTRRSKVHSSSVLSVNHSESSNRNCDVRAARRMLMAVWLTIGMVPLLLQGRSYLKFVAPHKLTGDLVVPAEAKRETENIADTCPVEGLFIAHVWWNIAITYYYTVEHRQICHFVIPQYNIHGSYIIGTKKVARYSTAPENCGNESYYFEHYFYHGSIGYYSFYEEAIGTYCEQDKTAYVRVRGLGTIDMNGEELAEDRGDVGYRQSYWYGIFGAIWISYRSILLRKSYTICKQYGRRCDRMQEKLRRKNAVVFMHESMRLSAHGTTNYHRMVMLYMLLEGIMSDLFLLIAQDGLVSRVQYISLGYNLAGILSMLFEIMESTLWWRDNVRLFIKRLLFSYETSLLGELLCAGLMQYYLTFLNRSSLRNSRPTAVAISYYAWSLIGHSIIAFGLTAFVISILIVWATYFTWWSHGTLAILLAPCCVDTTLGVRSKMIMLGGYMWEEGQLYYKVDALRSFGILKMVADDGDEFFVIRKVNWLSVPRRDLVVIGRVSGHCVEPCSDRLCTGTIRLFDHHLGGDLNQTRHSRPHSIRVDNIATTGPKTLSVLPSYKLPATT
ncbi:unnamed protein product [Phytophthora fragariaefolia]|uniref:Unnamed protein product n=1 Tax=Phytophthora fragariaefolia TaxID=1490495 RepID=A0A9W6XAL9_9STRA|nr:unnamed protein product [Phytophthora fragariaefolia]